MTTEVRTPEEIKERIKNHESLIKIMKEGSALFPGREEEIIRTHTYARQELEWVLKQDKEPKTVVELGPPNMDLKCNREAMRLWNF
ncbi:MAG: hypothetical protein KAQ99_05725 [Candidatus Aureabacteria bacterium]|nr:hypothetical protein [Candidatus Auribacterota bacterium]